MSNKITLEVVNFRDEIKRIEAEVFKLAETDLFRLIDYATEQLSVVTPVDTGEARAGWYNQKRHSLLTGGQIGSLRNDVEHVEYLNRGSSKQAPKFFIEQTLFAIGIIDT